MVDLLISSQIFRKDFKVDCLGKILLSVPRDDRNFLLSFDVYKVFGYCPNDREKSRSVDNVHFAK